jgi:hypothetical protein
MFTRASTTLRDTTLRSVIFGKKDVSVVPGPGGQMILADQVDKTAFDTYEQVLKVMGQLSRMLYCDAGIIREVIMSPAFGTADNVAVSAKITELDAKYNNLKRAPSTYPQSKDGRPMQSYVITPSQGTAPFIGQYVSSPSDLTYMFLTGAVLQSKFSFFQPTDVVLIFKGSSTLKNFKHDIYSQFTPADLSKMMPPGTAMSTGAGKNNIVPASFIKPLLKSWELLKQSLIKFNPTRLFVTGQSLGAAYASVFTFIMAEIRAASFPSIQSIHAITFGSPTVVSDGARNTFNAHLDSGFVTLDRVTSYGIYSRLPDIIPFIPVAFSHPGFQPLRTEIYPEFKTGRAYALETVRKVYQKGGLFGIGSEKGAYEVATKSHMPNKIVIGAKNKIIQAFPHGEYFDITYLGIFRLFGMKNPGMKASDGAYYTFVADLFEDGIKFQYVPSAESVVAEEPTDTTAALPGAPPGVSAGPDEPTDAPPATGGRRNRLTRKKNRKQSRTRSNRR